jgi:hypothetical protein
MVVHSTLTLFRQQDTLLRSEKAGKFTFNRVLGCQIDRLDLRLN